MIAQWSGTRSQCKQKSRDHLFWQRVLLSYPTTHLTHIFVHAVLHQRNISTLSIIEPPLALEHCQTFFASLIQLLPFPKLLILCECSSKFT